jgi:hypothetical protein
MSSEQSARLLIDATTLQVRAVLLEPLRLPGWNPAFRRVTGPAQVIVDQRYSISVRPGLSGHFSYRSIERDRIDTRWDVRGFTETASWRVGQHGNRTEVIHGFEHTGPLAAVLSPAYRGVAELRLRRLAQRVADLAL